MNTSINRSAKCYGLYDGDEIIGFCAVMFFPHPIVKNLNKVHRIVILPDYQGMGIGRRFVEFIGTLYLNKGRRFAITTSSKSAIRSFMSGWHFIAKRCSAVPHCGSTSTIKKIDATHRCNVKTVTLEYVR